MECWVSKQGKKGHWSSFLKKFLKIFKNEDFKYQKNIFGFLGPPYNQKKKKEQGAWSSFLKKFLKNIQVKI